MLPTPPDSIPDDDDDRRLSRRVPVALRAFYRSPRQTLDTHVTNLSQGGLFLSAPSESTLGTPAHVELEIPGEEQRFVLPGEVAWCGSQGKGIGVRFFEPTRKVRLVLANFLLRLTQKNAD